MVIDLKSKKILKKNKELFKKKTRGIIINKKLKNEFFIFFNNFFYNIIYF